MAHYEYDTVGLKWDDNKAEILKQRDKDGWELVSVHGSGRYIDRERPAEFLTFRRPKSGVD